MKCKNEWLGILQCSSCLVRVLISLHSVQFSYSALCVSRKYPYPSTEGFLFSLTSHPPRFSISGRFTVTCLRTVQTLPLRNFISITSLKSFISIYYVLQYNLGNSSLWLHSTRRYKAAYFPHEGKQ